MVVAEMVPDGSVVADMRSDLPGRDRVAPHVHCGRGVIAVEQRASDRSWTGEGAAPSGEGGPRTRAILPRPHR
jgi:hypothetical protein